MSPDSMLQYLGVAAALAAAWVAFRKATPERRRIGVESVGIAVDAQQKIIDDQQSVISELRAEMVTMKREHQTEIGELRKAAEAERTETRMEVVELREENERLQSRLFALEDRLS